jgi:hypothetical protein
LLSKSCISASFTFGRRDGNVIFAPKIPAISEIYHSAAFI